MPTIIVDHREKAPLLFGTLKEEYGLDLHVAQLTWGDYVVEPDTVVERKTAHDFCVSLMQGRLFRQAYWLAECTDNPLFLIEGAFHPDDGMGMRVDSIKGALVTLAQSFRMPVLRSRDQRESAWMLNRLHEQRHRVTRNCGPLHRYRGKRVTTQKLHVLRSLPGIGPKLATVLLDEFGTVSAVAAARPERLQAVPGLGPTRAAQIHRALHETEPAYGTRTCGPVPATPDSESECCRQSPAGSRAPGWRKVRHGRLR
jgi:ERCC4-type nuclease